MSHRTKADGWDTTKNSYRPDGGREARQDGTILDVAAWRDEIEAELDAQSIIIGQGREFFFEVAKGNVAGHSIVVFQASNKGMGTEDVEQSFWNISEATYQYLSSPTQLYISSTSTSDTAVVVTYIGLDENWNEVFITATLNGQSQVAIGGTMRRVRLGQVTGSTAPVGDIYLAESDGSISGGVPSSNALIQLKIEQRSATGGNSTITVPLGKTYYFAYGTIRTGKGQAIDQITRVRIDGGIFVESAEFGMYEAQSSGHTFYSRFPEKTDLEIWFTPLNPNIQAVNVLFFIAVDNV